MSAGEILPLPYQSQKDATDHFNDSPLCSTSEILNFYAVLTPPSTIQSTNQRPRRFGEISTHETYVTELEIDDSSPSQTRDFKLVETESTQIEGTPLAKSRKELGELSLNSLHMHKVRLSRSLSSTHALAEELIPKPLFKTLPITPTKRPLPPLPSPRSLPPLPPFHQDKSQFIVTNDRIKLVRNRKTAVATLISRFEEHSPFDYPAEPQSTPVTERFRQISKAFGVNHHISDQSEEAKSKMFSELVTPVRGKMSPSQIGSSLYTPRVKSKYSPEMEFSTGHEVAYSHHLACLRTAILEHIKVVSRKIEEIRQTQAVHEDEKRKRFTSMHLNRHSFDAKSAPSSNRESPVKDGRLKSFWNLQIAEAQEQDDDLSARDKARTMKKRIAELRADNWKRVTKEAKGWKGQAYYNELRRKAEMELTATR